MITTGLKQRSINAVEIKIRNGNEIIEFRSKDKIKTSSVRIFILWLIFPSVILILIAIIFKNQTGQLLILLKRQKNSVKVM